MKAMWVMFKLFIKSFIKYRKTLERQEAWISKFAKVKGYSVNGNWMFNTNLKLWLSEAEDTFGQRICPCFSPTGDERDQKMLCPCKYMDADIESKDACHCTLFAAGDADKGTYKKAMKRLMKEYQAPFLYNENNEIDIRKYPMDEIRGLRVPDAYHIVKRASAVKKQPFAIFVEHDYEVKVLETWTEKNKYDMTLTPRAEGFSVMIKTK